MQIRANIRGAKGLSDMLGVSVTTAEGIIRRREIEALKIGRAVIITPDAYDAYLAKLKAQQAPAVTP
jgi:hypothetical protein